MDKKTVIVVEDAISNYMYLNILLRDNYNVLHANNGQECLEMVAKQLPDVILLDIKMPVMDGITALKILRPKYPTLPIIMQTAYAFETDIEKAMALGASGYLTKPIMKDILYKTIEDCIKGSSK